MNTGILFPQLPLAALSSITFSFNQSDGINKAIIYIQVAMSIAAWSVMVSKWIELKKTLLLTRQFQSAYTQQQHPFSLFAARRRFLTSPLYTIYLAAAKEASFIAGEAAGASVLSADTLAEATRFRFNSVQMDIIRRSADRSCSEQAMDLEEKMPILAISITAAPLLGLLGTVWGVLDAFVAMSSNFGGAMLSAVAPGISGALLTTVVGLLVALPSAIGYNLIVNDIKKMCVHMDSFTDELLADLQSACNTREG